MTAWLSNALRRWIAGLLVAALLLPTLNGCVTPTPREIRLAGIVIDEQRRAGPDDSGLVRVVRGGTVLEGRTGMVLFLGDQIQVGPRAHVAIHYPNGSELLLRPGSSGRLGSWLKDIGEAFVRVRGFFAVQTDFVRSAAEGTAFAVRKASGGETVVTVFEGRVRCESMTGAWPTVRLGAGELAVAHPRPAQVQTAPAAELERIKSWVEMVERLVPPPGSAAPGATAAAAVGVGALLVAILASRGGRDDTHGRDTTRREPNSDRTPPPPPTLAAPVPLRPGDPGAPRATLDCRGPVDFSWRAVPQARDYVLTVEQLPPGQRQWQPVGTYTSADTVEPVRLREGAYRWTVAARQGTVTGPASPHWAFFCTQTPLR